MRKITQKELEEMIKLAWKKIEEKKEEINKINVFPVPDQDTGNNLAQTLKGIKKALEEKEFKDLKSFSEVVLEAALSSAQGNAGIIFAGFLAGFLFSLQKNAIEPEDLVLAMKNGAERAKNSIQEPKEGTILDVIEATARAMEKEVKKEKEIPKLFEKAMEPAWQALLATKEKMAVLKKANVVDAGGYGFFIILEAFLEALIKEKREEKEKAFFEEKKFFVQTFPYRYEVVFLVENPKISPKKLREKLERLGNSLEVLKIKSKIKVHIHTNDPEEVEKIAKNSGKVINLRVEDMAKEVVGEESLKTTSIGIVVEKTASLLPKIIERYQIEIVPVSFHLSLKEKKENLKKLYLKSFKKQLKRFKKVLCLSSSLESDEILDIAYEAEGEMRDPLLVYIFDTKATGPSQALFVLRAIELCQEEKEIGEIVEELSKLKRSIYFYFSYESGKELKNIKTIPLSFKKWFKERKKEKRFPIFEVKKEKLKKAGVTWADSFSQAFFKKTLLDLKKEKRKGKIRVVIAERGLKKEAEDLKRMLKEKTKAEVPFIFSLKEKESPLLFPKGLFLAWHLLE